MEGSILIILAAILSCSNLSSAFIESKNKELLKSLRDRPGSVLIIKADKSTDPRYAGATGIYAIRFDGELIHKYLEVGKFFLKEDNSPQKYLDTKERFPANVTAVIAGPDKELYFFRGDKFCKRPLFPVNGLECPQWYENRQLFGCNSELNRNLSVCVNPTIDGVSSDKNDKSGRIKIVTKGGDKYQFVFGADLITGQLTPLSTQSMISRVFEQAKSGLSQLSSASSDAMARLSKFAGYPVAESTPRPVAALSEQLPPVRPPVKVMSTPAQVVVPSQPGPTPVAVPAPQKYIPFYKRLIPERWVFPSQPVSGQIIRGSAQVVVPSEPEPATIPRQSSLPFYTRFLPQRWAPNVQSVSPPLPAVTQPYGAQPLKPIIIAQTPPAPPGSNQSMIASVYEQAKTGISKLASAFSPNMVTPTSSAGVAPQAVTGPAPPVGQWSKLWPIGSPSMSGTAQPSPQSMTTTFSSIPALNGSNQSKIASVYEQAKSRLSQLVGIPATTTTALPLPPVPFYAALPPLFPSLSKSWVAGTYLSTTTPPIISNGSIMARAFEQAKESFLEFRDSQSKAFESFREIIGIPVPTTTPTPFGKAFAQGVTNFFKMVTPYRVGSSNEPTGPPNSGTGLPSKVVPKIEPPATRSPLYARPINLVWKQRKLNGGKQVTLNVPTPTPAP